MNRSYGTQYRRDLLQQRIKIRCYKMSRSYGTSQSLRLDIFLGMHFSLSISEIKNQKKRTNENRYYNQGRHRKIGKCFL
jgi:hypothetical protein